MWRTIAEVQKKYEDRRGLFVAPGPTADDTGKVIEQNHVIIGINRSIVIRNDFDFVFIDQMSTVEIIKDYMENTKYLCLPFWSNGRCNLNSELVQRNQNKILFYVWVYECDGLFTAPRYPLNNLLLYVSWGNAQSVVHFAKLIGLSHLTIIGCDGGLVDGQLSATKIEKIFGEYKPGDAKKRTSSYEKTRSKLEQVAAMAKMPISIYTRGQ